VFFDWWWLLQINVCIMPKAHIEIVMAVTV